MMKKILTWIFGIGALLSGILVFTFVFGKVSFTMEQKEFYLDPLKFYSGSTFKTALIELGELGRLTYLSVHKYDYLFILFLYPFLFLLLSENKYYRWMPLVAMIGDLFENILIDLSIQTFPVESLILGTVAGIATGIKTIFVYSAVLSVLYLKVPMFKKKNRTN